MYPVKYNQKLLSNQLDSFYITVSCRRGPGFFEILLYFSQEEMLRCFQVPTVLSVLYVTCLNKSQHWRTHRLRSLYLQDTGVSSRSFPLVSPTHDPYLLRLCPSPVVPFVHRSASRRSRQFFEVANSEVWHGSDFLAPPSWSVLSFLLPSPLTETCKLWKKEKKERKDDSEIR